MPFQLVGDNMSWKSTGAFVRVADDAGFAGDSIVYAERQSNYKYFFYIRRITERGSQKRNAQRLSACYEQCLAMAEAYRCETIVFPLLGERNCGLSKEQELDVVHAVCRNYLSRSDMDIYLSVPNRGTALLPERKFSEISAYVNRNYAAKNYFSPAGDFAGRAPAPDRLPDAAFCAASRMESSAASSKRQGRARFAGAAAVSESLNGFVNNNSAVFPEYLQKLINRKGLSNADVYKRANLTKQYFSKLMNGLIKPAKEKLLCIAVALQLNLDETVDFLRLGGYAFSPCSKTDLVFQYFILHRDFDIYNIDIALYDMGLPTLTEY